ncbi:hypothetical protein [Litoribaculum gwangyangense]
MIKLKSICLLFLSLAFLGCSTNSDNNEESSECFYKNSMESFEIEPGQCVIISENPDMTLVFVSIENHVKSNNTDYFTTVTVRLEETNFTWETPHEIHDNPNTEAIDFKGEILTGINEDSYAIYVDNIEFTEKETEFIFHKALVRVEYTTN